MPASEPRPRAPSSRRALLLAAPAVYVAVAAARAGEARPGAWAAIAAGMAVALWAARGAPDEPAPRTHARRGSLAALSVAIATAPLPASTWTAALRGAAATLACVIGARAILVVDADAGLAGEASRATTPRLMLSRGGRRAIEALAALPSASAVAGLLAWPRDGAAALAPLLAAGGGAAALFALGALALAVASMRRLELGAPPRALASAGAAGGGLVLALAVGIGTTIRADAAAALGTTAGVAAIVPLAAARDPMRLARRARRALTLAAFAGPVVVLAALAVEAGTPGAGAVALVIAAVTTAIGALGPRLEEPFLPLKGLLLDALAEAREVARDRDARDAIARALARLREASSAGAPSPELWMLHPTRVCTVDAAGYLREREAELPASLFAAAASEPHATLRTEVLSALEVRRADLRPLLRWLEDRGALSATLVGDTADPDGVLLLMAGTRVDPMTLEEVRATKLAADSFVAVCQSRSARERHLARERDLVARIESLEDALARVEHARALDVGRNELASTRLARPATVGIYAAASRMAFEALERRVAQDAPVALVAPAGLDPVPYLARAHLAGPRREGPLVIVDGTSSREHDLERWRDERTSPLALADRGLLVLVDGAALPRDVQVLVARALAERRPPWERAAPLDVAVALTGVTSPAELSAEGRLCPELFARFEDATAIVLPGLSERAEDLRSIVADRLAREGLRVRGRPLGIDAAAFARLVEHPFEGEDAELATIVVRLARRATGDVVRAEDVEALGLSRPGEPEGPGDDLSNRRRKSSTGR